MPGGHKSIAQVSYSGAAPSRVLRNAYLNIWAQKARPVVPWNLQLKIDKTDVTEYFCDPTAWVQWGLLASRRVEHIPTFLPGTDVSPYCIPLRVPHRPSGTQGFVFVLSTPRHCPHVRHGRIGQSFCLCLIRLKIPSAVGAMPYNNPVSIKSVSH